MRCRLRTLIVLLAAEALLLTALVPVVRQWRRAVMRANCVNGMKEMVLARSP